MPLHVTDGAGSDYTEFRFEIFSSRGAGSGSLLLDLGLELDDLENMGRRGKKEKKEVHQLALFARYIGDVHE